MIQIRQGNTVSASMFNTGGSHWSTWGILKVAKWTNNELFTILRDITKKN